MLIYNAKIYTMSEAGVIENGFVEIKNGKISSVGAMSSLESEPSSYDESFDAKGANLYPGFIDCHTHLGMWENGITTPSPASSATTTGWT